MWVQWQIWDVDWPHEDGTEKRRPAVLITPDDLIGSDDFLHFLKISTQFRHSRFRVDFPTTDPDFALTGLLKPSYLYADNVRRIPLSKIHRLRGFAAATLRARLILLLRQRIRETGSVE